MCAFQQQGLCGGLMLAHQKTVLAAATVCYAWNVHTNACSNPPSPEELAAYSGVAEASQHACSCLNTRFK
jgi:hypothetical protein